MNGRRVVFTGPHQVVWEEFALPERLGPHEILVETSWSAISAGTELALYSGTHIGFSLPHATYPRYPHYPGYAAVGTILAVGDEIDELAPGQAVCLPGHHSSHTVWDSRRPPLAPLPPGVPPDLGSFARLATISLNGVRLGQVTLGDAVLVLGAGLIGQFAAQFARLAGGRPVVVADLLPHRLQAARQCAPLEVINPADDNLLDFGRQSTGGRGFDVAIEATGAPAAVAQTLTLAAPFGRVVLLGSPRGRVELDPYTHIHRPGVTIIGAHELTTPRAETIHSRWTAQQNLELVLALLARNDLAVEPVVSHRLPATAATALYADLDRQPDAYLGVTLDWSIVASPERSG